MNRRFDATPQKNPDYSLNAATIKVGTLDFNKVSISGGTPAPVFDNSGGYKLDTGKLRTDLIPYDALNAITEVFTSGAVKYGDRNWEKGMQWTRLFGSLMRHSWSWMCGQDNDPETGKSHMAHAGCCAMMLLAYQLRKAGTDDRLKETQE